VVASIPLAAAIQRKALAAAVRALVVAVRVLVEVVDTPAEAGITSSASITKSWSTHFELYRRGISQGMPRFVAFAAQST
jgi:hypothetical protein